MVIILQQTMDNGRRFVSTVVEEESSLNSSFSVGSSHNSISERSAVYKQRIDSLFGRHTRLSPFNPNTLEPFSIRIENSRVQYNGILGGSGESAPVTRSTAAGAQQQIQSSSVFFKHHLSSSSSSRNPHHQGSSFSPGRKSAVPLGTLDKKNPLGAALIDTDFSTSSEDENDDYEKIDRVTTNGSFKSDSLNTHPPDSPGVKCYSNKNYNRDSKKDGSNTLWLANGATHVSTVTLNCESADDGPANPHSMNNMSCSNNCSPNGEMSQKGCNNKQQTIGESHMWHNGNYTESPCTADERQYGIVRAVPGGILKFTVDYLGCVPVDGTTTALQDLQAPLRSLYMNYLTGRNLMGGKLAITTDGIRFEAPKLRLVNPFATIAVWAAIKFVARSDGSVSECAFMPLISDPEGQDKSRLFSNMSSELHKAYTNCLNRKEQQSFRNPPIFACVMREASFSLDCHAFACKCAEDAIVIAANLYQSLVDKMRAVNKEGESGYGSLTRNSPASTSQGSPNQNHHRSSSSASSQGSPAELSGGSSRSNNNCCPNEKSCRINGGGSNKHDHRVVFSDSESVVPVRPPRRKKKLSDGNLKRYNSDDSVIVKVPQRRRSFKGSHPPQYSRTKKRVQISAPDETTSSDSVNECIDHVLDRVIHPGGMSFNDLKPPYQELILKIALTLTQDQLYQKSKQAMKKHQQVNFRKKGGSKSPENPDDNSQFLNMLLKSFSKITSTKSGPYGKRKVGKMSNSSFKNKLNYPPKVILKKPKEEQQDPFQSICSGCTCDKCSDKCYCSLPSKQNAKAVGLLPPAPPTSPINSSSSVGSNNSKGPTPPARDKGNIKDKIKQNKNELQNNNKKTCGYDTDSCAESEKCYCSLQRVKSNGLKIYNINLDTETSDTDTNSYDFEPFNQNSDQSAGSTSSEKSNNNNCKGAKTRPVEILSYHPAKKITYNLSNSNVQMTNALVHFEDKQEEKRKNSSGLTGGGGVGGGSKKNSSSNCKVTTRNHSLVSSSYLHSKSPGEKLSSEAMGILHHQQRNKVLLITGSNPSTRLMYKDSHVYDGKKSRADHRNSHLVDIEEDEDVSNEEDHSYRHHRLESSNDDEMTAPDKIISMKKTAEIAAMFTDLRLDPKTNNIITVAEQNNSSSFADSSHSTPDDSNGSLDFEASLGYLP